MHIRTASWRVLVTGHIEPTFHHSVSFDRTTCAAPSDPAARSNRRRRYRLTLTCSVLACALAGAAGQAVAGGVIPSAGEIIHAGTLLNAPCSITPPPAENESNWGPEKNGTPYIGMDVHTEFYEVDSHGQLSQYPVGNADTRNLKEDPGPTRCVYNDNPSLAGIKAVNRGIWLMRVHHVRINREFEFTEQHGWVPAAGDGADAVTDIRFEVVDTNSCANSAWVGVGPTDPACLRQKQKKAASEMAKWEQQELQITKPDYQSMCGIGNLHGSMDYRSGKAGACIGYELSIKSEESDMQANRRLAHDPPNPDYMTLAVRQPEAQPELSKLPATWAAYRAVLTDLDWVTADALALVTAIERANGAYAATPKNPAADQWTQRQNKAAYDAMIDAVDRVGDAENNLPAAQSELIAARIPEATVDKLIGMETRRVKRADALIELLR